MPIEFPCPNCSRLLRTPDESAGKKAKCPQCGAIADIPAASSPPAAAWPIPTESPGLPPNSPFGPGGSPPPPKPSPFGDDAVPNPYASPAPAASGAAIGTVDEPPRPGLPWEREGKSVRTYWNSCKMILSEPSVAFSVMQREGGFATPLVFALIGGVVGGLLAGTYNTLLQLGLLTFVAGAGGPNLPQNAFQQSWIQVAIQLPTALAGGTIGVLIGLFITAGIYHLFLMMLGGANFPYETTYRVVAYVTGATALAQVIPLCGQYVVGLMALIYTILGLSSAHRIGAGKAAAAVLLPIAVCGVICGVTFAAIIGYAVATGVR